jgi:hypothetical protein
MHNLDQVRQIASQKCERTAGGCRAGEVRRNPDLVFKDSALAQIPLRLEKQAD